MTTNDPDTERLRDRIPTRRIAHVLVLALVLVVVIPFVIYAVPQVVGAESSYVVLSGSMQPTMNPGDVVVVDDVAASDIETGDIITFQRGEGNSPTTHRVVEVLQDGETPVFRTAGDNSESPDQQPVTPAQIEGRVPEIAGMPFVIPMIGYVIRFAATQNGFLLLVAVPVGLLFVTELWSLSKRFRSNASTEDDSDGTVEEPARSADDRFANRETVFVSQTEPDNGDHPLTHVDSAALSGSFGGSALSKKGDDSASIATNGGGSLEDGTPVAAGRDSRKADSKSDSETDAVTFTAPELELGLLVLTLFLGYSGWVAMQTTQIWAFTVAGSVGAAFLLLSLLYLAGRLGADSTADTEQSPTAESQSRPRIESKQVEKRLVDARLRADALTAALVASQAGIDTESMTDRPSFVRFERGPSDRIQSTGGGDDD